ncbi:MAG TPA: hypothetical protein VE200_04135 [Xanthobacteraceae bacterium]|jgi:transcription elongation GreA/GreB family factor|nr:hypothetical protein [Xanthobacteraceae bacterium]
MTNVERVTSFKAEVKKHLDAEERREIEAATADLAERLLVAMVTGKDHPHDEMKMQSMSVMAFVYAEAFMAECAYRRRK